MSNNNQFKKVINNAIAEFQQNGNSDQFNSLCEYVLKFESIPHIIDFASNVTGVDVKKFGLAVARDGTAKQNFQFACIPGSDSRMHRDIIIQSGDIEFNFKAGKHLNDEYREEYVNKHGEIVLKGTPYLNLKYISDNKAKSLNKQPHFDMIINSNNAYINYICAKQVAGADILAHGKAVIDCKDVATNLSYAHIAGADVNAHLDIVLNYGTEYDCLEVLKTFDSVHKTKFVVKIFDSNDNDVKIECLRWLESKGLLDKAKKLNSVYDFIEDLKSGYILPNSSQKL